MPEEPGGWTAPEVMPSVSSSGRSEAETGGVTTTSESVGEGGVGERAKPAARGGEISRSGLERSLRGKGEAGVMGADTQGTTFVTTRERKEDLGGGLSEEAVAFLRR